MKKIGLVLEGGGMRGAYTAGVLDAIMDENINFNYVIGVSAGASNGASYISEQRGRNKKVFVDHALDKEASGFKYFLFGDGFLNMDYLYNTLPNEKEPFDYKAFKDSKKTFKIAMTNADSGNITYMDNIDIKDRDNRYINEVLKASSSLPIITKPVNLDGVDYFDGGIIDSIPIRKSELDGNKYNVLILTQNINYRKDKQKLGIFSRKYLKRYPKVLKALEERHNRYNSTVEYILENEKKGNIFVFRPIEKMEVSRLEKNQVKLEELYNTGYKEAMDIMDKFYDWYDSIP